MFSSFFCCHEERIGVFQTMAAKNACSIEASTYQPSRWRSLRILLITFVVIIVALVVAIVALAIVHTSLPHCSLGRASSGRDFNSPGLFNDLTPAEMRAVRDYLMGVEELGLVPVAEATVNSSYIYMIDLQVQNGCACLLIWHGKKIVAKKRDLLIRKTSESAKKL